VTSIDHDGVEAIAVGLAAHRRFSGERHGWRTRRERDPEHLSAPAKHAP
jgi:hypothetical protein